MVLWGCPRSPVGTSPESFRNRHHGEHPRQTKLRFISSSTALPLPAAMIGQTCPLLSRRENLAESKER
jgi:hypothetical protein